MSERLELLKPVLNRYERRFTVLDFGAGINCPTLGYEISQAFNAVVVEVEKGWKPVETGPRMMVLRHTFTIDDLQRFADCEHFDVVIAFNIIHWFEREWRAAADAILRMGDYVFVQIPTEADSPEAPGYAYIKQMQPCFQEYCEHIGSTVQFPAHPARPIYLRRNGVKHLHRTNLDAPRADADVAVYSTHKVIYATLQHKKPQQTKEWIPGISLWNFCRLGGVIPTWKQVQKMLTTLQMPSEPHGDIQPWNMILDGERVHLIDGFEYPGIADKLALAQTMEMVKACLKD